MCPAMSPSAIAYAGYTCHNSNLVSALLTTLESCSERLFSDVLWHADPV